MNLKDTLVASLVPIFLGFGFVIAKPAFESFPPILLMGLRFIFAASILIWWFPIPKGYLKRIFIASFIANTLQYSITYTGLNYICLLYTSPSPRDATLSRMPSSA